MSEFLLALIVGLEVAQMGYLFKMNRQIGRNTQSREMMSSYFRDGDQNDK